MNDNKLMNRAADNIRILAASMVEKANSGHPGGAMGGADFVNVLFSEFLVYDPQNPRWEGRDRFFLDPGHMSPMLYSVLALTGKYTLAELAQFRQWDSPTPGHPEVNVMRGVENTSGPLGQGHTYAVGLSMKEEHIKEFTARFEEHVARHILPDQMEPQIDIDTEINFNEITPDFFTMLKQFNPFGPGNQKPIFCTRRVTDYGTSRLVGKKNEHVKLELVDSKSKNIMNGIAFNMSQHFEHIKAGKPFDICYTIEENTHNNGSIQLFIKDMRPSE